MYILLKCIVVYISTTPFTTDWPHIIESVVSICRDGLDTPIYVVHNKKLKSSGQLQFEVFYVIFGWFPTQQTQEQLKKLLYKSHSMTTKPPSLFLPYVQGLSEKIQIACRKLGVRTVFKSSGTLRQLLTRVKSKTPELKKDVIYRIPCCNCEVSCTGETRRSLQKRIMEHKYAVKTNDKRNGISVHAWDRGHQPDWDAAEIVVAESHYVKRRVLEVIWIQKTPHTCNLDCGLTLNETWAAHIQCNRTLQLSLNFHLY